MTKHQQIREDYLKSGLTQKGYAKKIGMPLSQLRNRLNKAKEAEVMPSVGFSSLQIDPPTGKSIRITTPSGIVIELPL